MTVEWKRWIGYRWIENNFEPPLGDRELAEALVAAINAPPDPVRVERCRASLKGGTVVLASTPVMRGKIEFIIDERLGPGESYLLPKKAWSDAVNPNKEANVANNEVVVDVSKIQQGDSLWIDGVQFVAQHRQPLGGAEMVGKCFVDAVQRLMAAKGIGAFSDSQFEGRVSDLIALEAKVDREQHLAAHQQTIETVDGKCTACGLLTQAGHVPGTCPGKKFDTVQKALDAGLIPNAGAGLAKILGQAPGPLFHLAQNPDAFSPSNGFTYAGSPKADVPALKRMCSGCRKGIVPPEESEVIDGLFFHETCLDEAGRPYAQPIELEICPGSDEWSVRRHPTAHAFLIEHDDGSNITVPFEMVAKFFEHATEQKTTGECGGTERIGDQLRNCHCCNRQQTVDRFNLSLASHRSVGDFGDAEDLYVCDGCAVDVLKAVSRVRDGRKLDRGEPYDIDLIAGDA